MSLGTHLTFFEPNPDFGQWVKTTFPGKEYVDCGCGLGDVSLALNKVGMKGISLDLFPSEKAKVKVIGFAAQEWPFVIGNLPILARPCRGPWIYNTIEAAVKGAGMILYIGLQKWFDEDLANLPYKVELIKSKIGAEDENAWLISNGQKMRKREFEHIYAITVDYRGVPSKPILVGVIGDKKYWHCGLSYCMWSPKEDVILHDYTELYLNGTQIDVIEALFKDEFVPKLAPQQPCARLGWISPEGLFYPCAYCAHVSSAGRLVEQFIEEDDRSYDDQRTLYACNWMSIVGNGYVTMGDSYGIGKRLPTHNQLNTLKAISDAFLEEKTQGVNFNDTLTENPEDFTMQMWMTPPDENDDIEQVILNNLNRFLGDQAEVKDTELVLSKRIDVHPGD